VLGLSEAGSGAHACGRNREVGLLILDFGFTIYAPRGEICCIADFESAERRVLYSARISLRPCRLKTCDTAD
jgi:hypothetical protein